MLDFLIDKVNANPGNELVKYNYLRELLQLILLKRLDETGYFRNIAFVGGTALRILYDLQRFSEDLDFSLLKPDGFQFSTMIDAIENEFKHDSLNVEIKCKDRTPVANALFKFPGLLHKVGLSPHQDKVIFIKLDIDLNPPAGYQTRLDLVTKEFMVMINHYDLPSLYSGKLHALLQREYTKGRDYYDYLWYVGRNTQPNLPMLNNALAQSTGANPELTMIALQSLLKKRFEKTDFTKVINDVEPFLIDAKEKRFFNKDVFLNTLTV